ncbi:MAG: BTAD domain-containing putative transcriptional regulator [Alphaproteobacteria bacterium]
MVDASDLTKFASDAAFAVDWDSRIVAWNDRANDLLGYAPGEVIGRRCYDVIEAILPSGEQLCTPKCEGAKCFQHGQPFAVPTCKLRHKDGQWIPAIFGTLVIPHEMEARSKSASTAIVFLRKASMAPRQPQVSPTLRIFTLGRFSLAVGQHGLAIETWKRRQAVTLLKYLVAYQGRPVRRERLCDCLWPEADEAKAWGRLRVTLSFLRRQLRAAGMPKDIVETVDKSYILRRDSIWVDAVEFEKLVSEAAAAAREGRAEQALLLFEDARRLYRGDYLEEDLYTEWCAEERQRLREVYLEMLAGLADCYAASGRFAEAAQVCRTALCYDPCRESFLRSVLRHLVALGRPDWAEADYRHWQRVIIEHVGGELTAETEQLHQELIEKANAAASNDESTQPARSGTIASSRGDRRQHE